MLAPAAHRLATIASAALVVAAALARSPSATAESMLPYQKPITADVLGRQFRARQKLALLLVAPGQPVTNVGACYPAVEAGLQRGRPCKKQDKGLTNA